MAGGAGVLSSTGIAALIGSGAVDAAEPIAAAQIQPASLDLRLGPTAYRVRASFLPGRESVSAKIARLGMHAIDLASGAVLERGCVYIVPLMERLALDEDIAAHANPKSSTGRLDIFTRLIAGRGARVRPGQTGLPRAALRRGLAPHLQHRGAGGKPAQPAPLQARRPRLFRPRAGGAACRAPADRRRGGDARGSRAACRSPSISPAQVKAATAWWAGRRSATPT